MADPEYRDLLYSFLPSLDQISETLLGEPPHGAF